MFSKINNVLYDIGNKKSKNKDKEIVVSLKRNQSTPSTLHRESDSSENELTNLKLESGLSEKDNNRNLSFDGE